MSACRRPPAWRSSSPPATFSAAISMSSRRWPVGQLRVAFGGLEVDRVRRERPGVTPEQGVRERTVAPPEAGEVETDEQPDERVEQALAEVRDREPAARQQRAVRERVVEVAGDQQPVRRRRASRSAPRPPRRSADAPRRALAAGGTRGRARSSGSSLTTYDTSTVSTKRTTWRWRPRTPCMCGRSQSVSALVNGKPAIAGWSEGLAICSRTSQSGAPCQELLKIGPHGADDATWE